MTTVLRIKDADFSKGRVGIIMPVMSGLSLVAVLGGDAKLSSRNLAIGGKNLTPIGEITYQDEYASLASAANVAPGYIQTAVKEAAEQTVITVARATSVPTDNASRPVYIGSGNGPAQAESSRLVIGTLLIGLNATQTSYSSARWNGTSGNAAQRVTTSAPSSWRFIAGRCANTLARIDDKTGDVASSFDPSASGLGSRDPSSKPFRIGSDTATSYGGTCDVALSVIFDRLLSDDEITALYDFWAAYYVTRGITI